MNGVGLLMELIEPQQQVSIGRSALRTMPGPGLVLGFPPATDQATEDRARPGDDPHGHDAYGRDDRDLDDVRHVGILRRRIGWRRGSTLHNRTSPCAASPC